MRRLSLRGHTFMTSTRKEGGGILKFVTCLRILLFLNNRSIVDFCGWRGYGGGVKKLVIFCGRHQWMTPKTVLLKISQNLQENVCTGVSFLSAASNFINEEILAQCFPKLLTIFAKSSIIDVQLGYKYASVLPPDLKSIYEDFLL